MLVLAYINSPSYLHIRILFTIKNEEVRMENPNENAANKAKSMLHTNTKFWGAESSSKYKL